MSKDDLNQVSIILLMKNKELKNKHRHNKKNETKFDTISRDVDVSINPQVQTFAFPSESSLLSKVFKEKPCLHHPKNPLLVYPR
jgi:hypothetical protein